MNESIESGVIYNVETTCLSKDGRKIAEWPGGSIRVESDPGKGSTFYFTVPKEVRYELR